MENKENAKQIRMFKKEIPEMPEGYYSSGPNPNLPSFVEEHATPYDPETDDYDVPPFDKPIKTTKATAIYNMHTYWSKKPHDAIREYIQHYTQPGDLILDPFCGSGGTALAALMEGRKAIAIDLSPAATFITKHYCTTLDVDELQRAFEELEAAVKPEMDWLYETRCDRCDGRAMTNYTVLSYVFECPRCLHRIPLFDCPEAQIPKKSGQGTKKAAVCPFCFISGHLEEINSRTAKRFTSIPVLVNYECLDGCKPQKDFRRYNDENLKKKRYFSQYDLEKISEIERRKIPYWVPELAFPKNFSRWNSDLKNLEIYRVDQLYTKRNLFALAVLWDKINKSSIDLRIILTWIALKTSKMMRYCSDNVGRILSGTYYVPSIIRDSNIPTYFSEATSDIKKHFEAKNEKFSIRRMSDINVLISTQSASNFSDDINSNSVDYIFTDPPYSDTMQYGELNYVWEAWLGFNTNWHEQEIIINKSREKTEKYWADQMFLAMSECYRVLKPGRCISLCYHDTSEGTWQLVQDLMAEVGFIVEKVENTLYIDAKQKSFNQINAQKVTKRDLVINFRKPRHGETHSAILLTGDEDELSFNQKATAILAEALERNPGSTADHLYDELVSRMVRKGEFERHNFDGLLRSVAEEVRTSDSEGHTVSRWYLLETAGEVDAAESRKEEVAAQRLEAFMVDYLKAHPEFEGVHYSDLFEQYLPVQDKPRRLLADWLPEFFFRTPEGTWRPPLNDEERQQKQHLRASGTLRRVKRFANAITNSVPPAEKDRPENPATLAGWINQCRRAGLYDLGKLLYEQGGHSFESLSEQEQLAVQENYMICARRSQADSSGKKKSDPQASLF